MLEIGIYKYQAGLGTVNENLEEQNKLTKILIAFSCIFVLSVFEVGRNCCRGIDVSWFGIKIPSGLASWIVHRALEMTKVVKILLLLFLDLLWFKASEIVYST